MVEFAYFVRRAAEAATPWLVGSAIGFLVLWLVLLCRQKKAFAKLSAWFGALTPFGKLMAVAVVCLCTLWGGTKEGGDRGG